MPANTHGDRLDDWLSRVGVLKDAVPLFATDNHDRVETETYGYNEREVLARSEDMEQMIRREGSRVVEDYRSGNDEFEGLISMMLTVDDESPNIRYVDTAQRYARDGESLSANLADIETSKSKLARWGSGSYYHIGELSEVALAHHNDDSVDPSDAGSETYQDWYDALFSNGLRLREPVFFWIQAWESGSSGIHGLPTPLKMLENQVIGAASISPRHQLLNSWWPH